MLGRAALAAYGVPGLALSLASLPLHVFLPQYYATELGVPLAGAGLVLLAMRLLSACADPLIGMAIDRTGQRFFLAIVGAAPVLLGGFTMLFLPPRLEGNAALAWLALGLLVTYAGFGILSIAHQGWGAALSARVSVRSWLPASREAFGVAGVVLAAAAAGAWGYRQLPLLLGPALIAAVLALAAAPSLHVASPLQAVSAPAAGAWSGLKAMAANRAFRWLFVVLLVNGTASAIPATLFMFFASDHLGLGSSAPAFLIVYFCAAACSLPLWTRLSARLGDTRAWLLGMVGSALAFVWAAFVDAGAVAPFAAVCIASGLMLGADLALPASLLAGVIQAARHGGRYEAVYFGAWNWGVQMTLALAAGTALPLLALAGYVPGTTGGHALLAAYCLLPCGLKLLAAALLWRAPLRDI